MKKHIFLSVKIEHIIFALALISICSTFIFRSLESQKFQVLLNRLEYTKDNAQEIFEWNDSKKESYFLDLQNVFKPFTFYNEDVDNCLADFILIYKNPVLKNQNDAIFTEYIQLYKLLYQQQQQLSFGYAWILLISFFISLVLFFHFRKRSESRKTSLKSFRLLMKISLSLPARFTTELRRIWRH